MTTPLRTILDLAALNTMKREALSRGAVSDGEGGLIHAEPDSRGEDTGGVAAATGGDAGAGQAVRVRWRTENIADCSQKYNNWRRGITL